MADVRIGKVGEKAPRVRRALDWKSIPTVHKTAENLSPFLVTNSFNSVRTRRLLIHR